MTMRAYAVTIRGRDAHGKPVHIGETHWTDDSFGLFVRLRLKFPRCTVDVSERADLRWDAENVIRWGTRVHLVCNGGPLSGWLTACDMRLRGEWPFDGSFSDVTCGECRDAIHAAEDPSVND